MLLALSLVLLVGLAPPLDVTVRDAPNDDGQEILAAGRDGPGGQFRHMV